MKLFNCRVAVLLFLFSLIVIQAPAQQKKSLLKPNIILIIADDVSIDDIGCYGNPTIKTPNIDNIANNGLVFNNMFVTASSCSPSRSSIITGRYPHNTGAAELHTPLPAHLTYFPEQLRQNGYYTAQLGKWHEGKNTLRAYDTLIAGEERNGLGGEEQWIPVIKNRPKDKPFFLWLAPFDAHRTWSADTFAITHNPSTEVTVPHTLIDDEATRKDLASYYNEIGRIDHHIGQLNKMLQEEGVDKNTIIIFLGDNARPFPGSKTRVNDRGLKTPFIFYWPAGIQTPAKVNALVSTIDIAPTLLQLANITPAASIQGLSFEKLLQHTNDPFRKYIFGEHNWHDYEAYERSVRTKDYLYIFNGRPDFDNSGPIDGNQSPAALSLKDALKKGNLSFLQKEAWIKPRSAEEFYVLENDSLQVKNEMANKAYISQIASIKKILALWQQQTGDTQPKSLTPDWYDRNTGEPLPEKEKRGEMPGVAKKADYNNNKGPF